MMAAAGELTAALGTGAACQAVGLWRGAPGRQRERWHRRTLVGPPTPPLARPCPPLALDPQEQQSLLDTLNSERFADTAPAAVHATLLDEGRYLGSVRTMYRVLAANGGCRERRNQLTHPAYAKPELLAVAPNQVWSWDITKLKGPAKWTCFHLYVILDIFSRFVVGWLIAPRECSELAQQLIADTVARHNVEPGMLTLHADRGAAMRSKPVASLLVDLDVAKSHSRPHVSDDNPYSESQFKTMKYRPEFPARPVTRIAVPSSTQRDSARLINAERSKPRPARPSTSSMQACGYFSRARLSSAGAGLNLSSFSRSERACSC
jgi:transposase InsO family protein